MNINITIIAEDKCIVLDGEHLKFDFPIDETIWAIQWKGTSGHVEFNDGTPNKEITDFSDYQYLVDAYNVEKLRIEQDAEKAEIDRVANMVWVENRRESYPSIEEQLDMLYHDQVSGTSTWGDAISAVKAEFSKPKH